MYQIGNIPFTLNSFLLLGQPFLQCANVFGYRRPSSCRPVSFLAARVYAQSTLPRSHRTPHILPETARARSGSMVTVRYPRWGPMVRRHWDVQLYWREDARLHMMQQLRHALVFSCITRQSGIHGEPQHFQRLSQGSPIPSDRLALFNASLPLIEFLIAMH